MKVCCPRCGRHLLLTADVVGHTVRCPGCLAELTAEPDRLVSPDRAPGPTPRPSRRTPVELPREEDEPVDLALPPDHVFPAQRVVETRRNLAWAGLWLRIVAAADVLSLFVIAAVLHLTPLAGHRHMGSTLNGILCGLATVGPLAILLWLAAGGMLQGNTRGLLQPMALTAGLLAGLLVDLAAVAMFLRLVHRHAPERAWLATAIAFCVALATVVACGVALIVRRRPSPPNTSNRTTTTRSGRRHRSAPARNSAPAALRVPCGPRA